MVKVIVCLEIVPAHAYTQDALGECKSALASVSGMLLAATHQRLQQDVALPSTLQS